MKPFDSEDAAFQEPLTALETSRRKAEATARLCNLPLFSRGAIKLLTIANDDDGAITEFEEVFCSDPGLAAELLLLANSAQFGFQARISSIGHALSVLGLERARSLAARIAMSFFLRASSRKEVQTVWSHSIATAVLAEHIAAAKACSAPMLFTAALLHDLGSLGLLLTSQSSYPELIALKLVDVQESARIETVLWGLTHVEAGGILADTWGFPSSLRRCMSEHHGQVAESEDPVLHVVQLACVLASSLGYPEAFVVSGEPEQGLTAALPPELLHRPEFAPGRLHELISAQITPSH